MDDLELHEELAEVLRRRRARLRWYEYKKDSELTSKIIHSDFIAALIRKRRKFPKEDL